MDETLMRRSRDIEDLKTQLRQTKQMLEETLKKSEKLDNDLKEGRFKHVREMSSLQKVQSSQHLQISKLKAEIKNFESLSSNQVSDKNNLSSLNEEYEKLIRDSEKTILDNQKLCMQLEREIKASFVKYQKDKELAALWLYGQDLTSPEEIQTFNDVFLKVKALAEKKYRDFEQELTEIVDTMIELKDKIKQKQDHLNALETNRPSDQPFQTTCSRETMILETSKSFDNL